MGALKIVFIFKKKKKSNPSLPFDRGLNGVPDSTKKGVNQRSNDVSRPKQQRPETLTVTFTWQASNYKYINCTKGRLVRRFGLEVRR